MRLVSAFALAASLGLAAPAGAATVFTDNFDSETAALNANLTNFTETGNIDLVSSGQFGITCSGNCVDLDGTSGPGTITSLSSFAFSAGDTVRLFFDLGGSQRSSAADEFTAGFAFAALTTFVNYGFNFNGSDIIAFAGPTSSLGVTTSSGIAGSDPFSTHSIFFTAASAGMLTFNLGTSSGDNVGPLVDNIRLDITSAVPEPSTWAFMLAGFGAIGLAMRRRRKRLALA